VVCAQGLPNDERFAASRTHPLKTGQTNVAPRASLLATDVCCIGEVFVASQRFAVEFDRHTVGVAVRVPGGFMFFSSNDDFDAIDGRLFPRARALERALRKVGRSKQPAAAAPQRLSTISSIDPVFHPSFAKGLRQ
jgi:hypothetical protein